VFYMLGAFFCYQVVSSFANSNVGSGSRSPSRPGGRRRGRLLEVFVIRPVYKREHIDQLLLTYALVLIIADVARFIWESSTSP